MEDRRLRMVAVGVLAGMTALVCGLWYVQVMSTGQYVARQKNQCFRTVRLPPVRGKILDRTGEALADSRPCFNVNLYLEELRLLFAKQYQILKMNFLRETHREHHLSRLKPAEVEELERQARYLVASNLTFQVSSWLGHPQVLREDKFFDHYKYRRYAPMPVLSDMSMTNVARFYSKAARWPGTELEVQPLRMYPHGKLAAHLIGYLRRNERPDEEEDFSFNYPIPDYEGVQGIERKFDPELRGTGGKKTVLVNNEGYRESEEIWPEPVPGRNVVLCLDWNVQKAAEKALAGVGENPRGAVVAMDVRNGDLLAMASAPSFDPNDFIPGVSQAEWEQLNDPDLRPLFNRATYGAYPPGSTFKIIVALACLEAGKMDPHEIYHSKGYFELSARSHRFGDLAGPGDFDFRRAFMRSSNPYFMEFGCNRLGPSKLVAMGQRFHLGKKTGFILSTEEQSGYFPTSDPLQKRDGSVWRPGDTANLSIGQGEIAVTPLQLAVLTAGVANGGRILKPRLVERIQSQDPLDEREPEQFPADVMDPLPLDPKNLGIVQDAMLADVQEDGTGKGARIPGFRVGGKTGTAEVRGASEEGRKITWFASFGPYEAPRYAVVVMVVSGASGGGTCAPIARRVYEAIIRQESSHALSSLADRD